MICAPPLLLEVFAASPVPTGPISQAAAEAIARILLARAKAEGEEDGTQAGDGREGNGQ